MRSVGVFGGQLYASDTSGDTNYQGISKIGTALPTTGQSTGITGLPGTLTAGSDNWVFVFESSSSLYVADASNIASYNVVQYTLTSGTWALTSTISLNTTAPIYSIAGRTVGGSFVLYATTSKVLYAYTTASATTVVVATASVGVFRGVATVPINPAWIAASITGTASQTPSQTATTTSTRSSTPSVSSTSSNSGECPRGRCVHGCVLASE